MKYVDELLSETLRRINDSLPKQAVRLERLLKMDTPSVETIGGGIHYFDRDDLEKLVKNLPDHIAGRLHLPFVFTKRHDLGDSVYVIRTLGVEHEAFKILMNMAHLPESNGEYYTYKPVIHEFIRRYPSLAAIGYL
ncbi:hypothetical protein HRbin01_00848 [archaeon HR01]|nr:hypothetical protein HRbin01_00848 [archaeon HR01]